MDPRHDKPGVIRRRKYPRRDTDRRYRRHNYVAMEYDTTLADVITWATEHAAGIPFEEIRINFSTFSWEDDATADEIAAYEREQAAQAARTEKWEREHLAKLTEKYGVPAGSLEGGELRVGPEPQEPHRVAERPAGAS